MLDCPNHLIYALLCNAESQKKGHQKGSNFKEEDIALPLWELLLRAVKLEELL